MHPRHSPDRTNVSVSPDARAATTGRGSQRRVRRPGPGRRAAACPHPTSRGGAHLPLAATLSQLHGRIFLLTGTDLVSSETRNITCPAAGHVTPGLWRYHVRRWRRAARARRCGMRRGEAGARLVGGRWGRGGGGAAAARLCPLARQLEHARLPPAIVRRDLDDLARHGRPPLVAVVGREAEPRLVNLAAARHAAELRGRAVQCVASPCSRERKGAWRATACASAARVVRGGDTEAHAAGACQSRANEVLV